jgi:hypothetical protein
MQYLMGDFKISERMMRFSLFVQRLYNLCRSYGFEKGMIMPSRAFCSDENQGFPIILITKHFGTSKTFRVNPELKNRRPKSFWLEDKRVPVGKKLTANLFYFKKYVSEALEET